MYIVQVVGSSPASEFRPLAIPWYNDPSTVLSDQSKLSLVQVELDEDDPVPEPDPTDTEPVVDRDTWVQDMQVC